MLSHAVGLSVYSETARQRALLFLVRHLVATGKDRYENLYFTV